MASIRSVVIGAIAVIGTAAPALAQQTGTPVLPSLQWSFSGPFGHLDRASARRGFQIYAQNCANCHSMNFLHYRDLAGIGFTSDEIKAITADITLPAGVDAQGNPVTKPATPASQFRAPFASEDAARAALNGALPPDLSLIVSASPGGANYVAALLTGYGDPPAGVKLADGMNYNAYFPGHQIAMPPPLSEGTVTYTDGTVSTVPQNARDIATFLTWAANPEMAERKRIGFAVVAYLLGMAAITFAIKRRIWANVH